MGFQLEYHEKTSAGLQRVLVEQATRLCDDMRMDELETAVHAVRKRCKRVRALVRLLRPTCPEIYEMENAVFRDIGASLSGFRDVKVCADAFHEAIKGEAGKAQHFKPLFSILQSRDQAASEAGIKRKLGQALRQARRTRARLEKLKLPGELEFDLIEKGLRQSYKRGRKAMRQAYGGESEHGFHDWRKRVKDLGYQMHLLRDLWPPLLKPLRNQLQDLGELLGQENDFMVLRQTLGKGAGQGSARNAYDAFEKLLMKRVRELQLRARWLGTRIYAEGSSCFTRRMKVYWTIWRSKGSRQAD